MFTAITDFLEANRALAPSLVFEFAQRRGARDGADRGGLIASLADLGFRFSMDHVTDLRIEPRDLAERGFRFIKVPAALLLNRTTAPQAIDIHPADFSDLLGRFGIDLIAERIESEGTVVDLLDYDVRFGQGFLFSPPRPVRTEVLQGRRSRRPCAGSRVARARRRIPRRSRAPSRTAGPAGRRGSATGRAATGRRPAHHCAGAARARHRAACARVTARAAFRACPCRTGSDVRGMIG